MGLIVVVVSMFSISGERISLGHLSQASLNMCHTVLSWITTMNISPTHEIQLKDSNNY